MRLISAAPRGVTANSRSSATTCGRRLVMASSASSASASAKVSTSPFDGRRRAPCSAGQQIGGANEHGTGLSHRPSVNHRSATCGTIPPPWTSPAAVSRRDRRRSAHAAGARRCPIATRSSTPSGPRYTFAALEQEARTIARGLMALGVEPRRARRRLGDQRARVGRAAVRARQDRRDSRHRQHLAARARHRLPAAPERGGDARSRSAASATSTTSTSSSRSARRRAAIPALERLIFIGDATAPAGLHRRTPSSATLRRGVSDAELDARERARSASTT